MRRADRLLHGLAGKPYFKSHARAQLRRQMADKFLLGPASFIQTHASVNALIGAFGKIIRGELFKRVVGRRCGPATNADGKERDEKSEAVELDG